MNQHRHFHSVSALAPAFARAAAALALAGAGLGFAHAGPTSMPAQTLEMQVTGLNCALCSEAMKDSLKKAANANDLEPRLECGRIYLQLPPEAQFNEGAVSFTLLANGFTFKSVQPTHKTLSEIRATKNC